MSIEQSLQSELRHAMRDHDTAVVAVLRSALAALANAQAPARYETGSTTGSEHFAGSVHGLGAAETPRLEVSQGQQRAIVASEVADLSAHARRLEDLGHDEEAAGARRALTVLTAVLDRTG